MPGTHKGCPHLVLSAKVHYHQTPSCTDASKQESQRQPWQSVPRYRPVVSWPTRLAGAGQRVGLRHVHRAKQPDAHGSDPAQTRAFDLPLPAWSRGPHDGAIPGNRHLTRQSLLWNTAKPQCSQASKKELGGFSKDQIGKKAGVNSKYWCCGTIKLAEKTDKPVFAVAYFGLIWDN